jgi:FHA domain
MADAVLRPGRRCSKGHSLDPSWDSCPYCEAEQRSKEKTSGLGTVGSSDRQRTRVEPMSPASPQGNRVTRSMAPSPDRGEHTVDADTRRILGVLVTYTWGREGQMFPIREGKNFIGRGDVTSEAYHGPCDIQIPHDREMSAEHALILCRQGGYEILDQATSNGTILDGKLLKANQGTDLPTNAEIKTGATLWTFVKIPQGAAEVPLQAERPAERSVEPTVGKKGSGDTTVG